MSGPLRDEEGIVYGDIDLKVNEMARGIINITGLYSRWDILSLRVRQEDYEPIVPMEAMEAPGQPGSSARPQRAADASAADVAELRQKIAELERRLAEAEGKDE